MRPATAKIAAFVQAAITGKLNSSIASPRQKVDLVRCRVDVAPKGNRELEVVEPVSDDIADADDPGGLAVLQHQEVARAVTRHQRHGPLQAVLDRKSTRL